MDRGMISTAGRESGVMRTVLPLFGSVVKDPSFSTSPVKILTSSVTCPLTTNPFFVSCFPISLYSSSFMLDSPSNSEKSLVSVPDHEMLAPYRCRSGKGLPGSDLCFPGERRSLPVVPGVFFSILPSQPLLQPHAPTSLPPTLGNRSGELGSPDLYLIFLWKVKEMLEPCPCGSVS